MLLPYIIREDEVLNIRSLRKCSTLTANFVEKFIPVAFDPLCQQIVYHLMVKSRMAKIWPVCDRLTHVLISCD